MPSCESRVLRTPDEEDYNYFLTVIFPDSQVQILAYNRIVRDLNGLSKEEFLEAIRRQFTVGGKRDPARATRSVEHVS